jgi:hypothetical protein
MTRLYSYIVARDYGFAPNPFHGFCTLATCKPQIRGAASAHDWIVGTGSKTAGLAGCFVFVMQVSEALTFDEYWSDPRFASKRPNLGASLKHAYGDNIYHSDKEVDGGWQQEDSHHSLPCGVVNQKNVKTDTSRPRVLASTRFAYWGGSGPEVPAELRDFDGIDLCCTTQGHKTRMFTEEFVDAFEKWFVERGEFGYLGRPHKWASKTGVVRR